MSRQDALWLCLVAAAAMAGYWLRGTDMPRPEVVTAKPAVRQADNSLIAERKPVAKPKPAPHQIPKGAVEERRVAVTVQPDQPDCDPVSVDLSLIREGDGRRVIASSRNGLVLDALDIPIVPGLMPAPSLPWAVGGSYNPITRTYGAWVERDFARLRLGLDVMQDERGGVGAMVRAGWRFGL